MKIIIASTRTPKVNGVKRAVEKLSSHFSIEPDTIRFETAEADSGVSDTPTSIEELMRGARQRALHVFRKGEDGPVFSIGVEGGLFTVDGKNFLQSWTCAYDGTLFHYGSSGAIEIPPVLAAEVIQDGVDLGVAIDAFAQQADVRSRQGTFGILTDDLVTREDSFELAVIFALTPFLNNRLYKQASH